ncbi:MAG TPA: DeoR family transcriptional regulator [Anaerolinea sp.]|nr:DeoR family transcriptional regulator [Anaerolinea sp.]
MADLTERQRLLLEELNTRRALTIEEIQRRFSVSSATAYREIRTLVEHGEAVKTQGGIKLPPPRPADPIPTQACSFCGGEINERAVFIIQLKDGSRRKACCAHCGLMALGSFDSASALASDFLYSHMVNVRQAAFLLESSVSLCCQPSVLVFANHADAEHFQAGFGGQVCSLDHALQRLNAIMNI